MNKQKLAHEETAEDHDEFFETGTFASAGGNIMSLTFYVNAMVKLYEIDSFKALMEWKGINPNKDGHFFSRQSKSDCYS